MDNEGFCSLLGSGAGDSLYSFAAVNNFVAVIIEAGATVTIYVAQFERGTTEVAATKHCKLIVIVIQRETFANLLIIG